MMVKTVFSGFGGQGVLMMGVSFAHSGMSKGYHVTYLPAYGAEMRGGTANCTVAVADEEVASPVASEPNYLVVMKSPSLFTFQNKVTAGGTILINASIIKDNPHRHDVKVFRVPCADMAQELGNIRVSNTIMMGAFIKILGIISPDIYLKSLETVMGSKKKALAELNRNAFNAGYEFVKNT
jgi:2-oxoglutarate ferredoxin oxidoreductase subunit gamma